MGLGSIGGHGLGDGADMGLDETWNADVYVWHPKRSHDGQGGFSLSTGRSLYEDSLPSEAADATMRGRVRPAGSRDMQRAASAGEVVTWILYSAKIGIIQRGDTLRVVLDGGVEYKMVVVTVELPSSPEYGRYGCRQLLTEM